MGKWFLVFYLVFLGDQGQDFYININLQHSRNSVQETLKHLIKVQPKQEFKLLIYFLLLQTISSEYIDNSLIFFFCSLNASNFKNSCIARHSRPFFSLLIYITRNPIEYFNFFFVFNFVSKY